MTDYGHHHHTDHEVLFDFYHVVYIRYGNIDELKDLVKRFHGKGVKVLGDAVLNHRCAHYKNGNGVWNIFGGRLNWDDRAVVADDPHFQVLEFFYVIPKVG
jgi:1,4-alpha-glucan branching enzyme